jgi:hypothetical protein
VQGCRPRQPRLGRGADEQREGQGGERPVGDDHQVGLAADRLRHGPDQSLVEPICERKVEATRDRHFGHAEEISDVPSKRPAVRQDRSVGALAGRGEDQGRLGRGQHDQRLVGPEQPLRVLERQGHRQHQLGELGEAILKLGIELGQSRAGIVQRGTKLGDELVVARRTDRAQRLDQRTVEAGTLDLRVLPASGQLGQRRIAGGEPRRVGCHRRRGNTQPRPLHGGERLRHGLGGRLPK